MNKEEYEYVSASLASIGACMQDKFDEGFRVVADYPQAYGWQYVVKMERSVPEVEVAKKPGRPPKAA